MFLVSGYVFLLTSVVFFLCCCKNVSKGETDHSNLSFYGDVQWVAVLANASFGQTLLWFLNISSHLHSRGEP